MAEAGDLSIEIVEDIISSFKADVLVNSTNHGLQLDIGALSKSFLQGAGQEIQDECVKNYPWGVRLGKIAVTDGYKLPCRKVYHGALPAWNLKEKGVKPPEILCEFICACLEQAHTDGARSIAFPTLGCGFLNYPHLKVAATLCQCIAIFKSRHEQTSLSHLYVVVYNKGQDWRHIKQAFLKEFGKASSDRGAGKPGARGNIFSAVKIRILRNILPERRDPRSDPPKKPLKQEAAQPHSVLMNTCMREQAHNSCKKVLLCGHICPGVKDEKRCPDCIQSGCPGRGALKQSVNDVCFVCYTETLAAAPVLQKVMEHPLLVEELKPLQAIKDDVRQKALTRLQFEGLDKSAKIISRDSQYFNKPTEFAMDRYCYYPCFKCNQAYFGGVVQREQGVTDIEFEAKDLVCPAC